MCSVFNYGNNPPSSAAIESQFNDLKHRVLKHVNSMPMRVDDFLKAHILSINGSMKLINAKINKNKSNETLNFNTQEQKHLIIDFGDNYSDADNCLNETLIDGVESDKINIKSDYDFNGNSERTIMILKTKHQL